MPAAPPRSDKWTIHLVRYPQCEEDDGVTTEDLRKHLLQEYPDTLLHDLKRGDALEDINGDGYRSSGVMFVESVDPVNKELNIVDRNFDVDDYGAPPLHFTCLDAFPPNYFLPDNADTNNAYHPGSVSQLYWHSDSGWNYFSPDVWAQIVIDTEGIGRLEYSGLCYSFTGIGADERFVVDGYLVTVDYDDNARMFSGQY